MEELDALFALEAENFAMLIAFLGTVVFLLSLWLTRIPIGSCLRVRVVWVCDGDTLIVKGWLRKFKVRLAGMDAPEGDQAFGEESRDLLRRLVDKKMVSIRVIDKDHWGRYVAFVQYGHTNINIEMVKQGLAWAYKQYFYNLSTDERKAFISAENLARGRKIGLWSIGVAEEPWKHRRENQSTGTWLHFLWLKIKRFFFGRKTYNNNRR